MALITPKKVAFYIPGNLKKFKLVLFEKIGNHIRRSGGLVVYHDPAKLDAIPSDVVPIVGCHPELRSRVDAWSASGREWIYWDRGYAVRIFATWLRRPEHGSGYYKWTRNAFQMKTIRAVDRARWRQLRIEPTPWSKEGRHIVIAKPSDTYNAFHRTEGWLDETVAELKRHTDRPIVIREKLSEKPLAAELQGAHALVTHQSNAAVEAAILGCPVFCDKGCAASLVGLTDLAEIERPIRPDRTKWLWSLAYSQFTEDEMTNGTLWNHLA